MENRENVRDPAALVRRLRDGLAAELAGLNEDNAVEALRYAAQRLSAELQQVHAVLLERFDRIGELEERLSNARWDYEEAMRQYDDQQRRACEAETRVKELEAQRDELTVLHKKWHDRAYQVLEKYEAALARTEALEARIAELEAQRDELLILCEELRNESEGWIRGRYRPEEGMHPAMQMRFERDMELIHKANAVIAKIEKEIPDDADET